MNDSRHPVITCLALAALAVIFCGIVITSIAGKAAIVLCSFGMIAWFLYPYFRKADKDGRHN
jgi:hypothetical protein